MYLNQARDFCNKALELIPDHAIDELGSLHNIMGAIYSEGGQFTEAVNHMQQAIHFKDAANNLYWGAVYRRNYAVFLADTGRLQDAMAYARDALERLDRCGPNALEDAQITQSLIVLIDKKMKY